MTLDIVLGSLKKVRKNGNGYVACCPAHEDKTPSLSVTMERDGHLLLHCFAGCSTEAVCEMLGLQLRDLMPVTSTHHLKRPSMADFTNIWSAAIACEIHPYLSARRVKSYGLRQTGESVLLVPMRDVDGKLKGLQRIWPDGDKRHMKGSKVRGHFFQIGEFGDRGKLATHLIICEGYATGATVYEALGWLTFVCFDAGNLGPVAGNLRHLYRHQKFIFAADNDRGSAGNPGVTKAREAAKKHGGIVAYPNFRANEPGSDWNDLEALHGMDAVEAIYDC